MWCILQAPLIIGSDLRHVSDIALATLSNKAAIAINQDPAAILPKVVAKTNTSQVANCINKCQSVFGIFR